MFSCPVRLPFVFWVAVTVGGSSVGDEVSFQRDVRPILSKHCFTCHGPDPEAREADLRLDTSGGATQDLGGYQAIAPGDPETSELIARITSDDPDLRMPPADSHQQLSPAAIEVLRAWITAGGTYETHWALTRPIRPAVPDVDQADWCRTPIDRFIKSASEAAGRRHAGQADKRTLLRRVTIDLTGALPTPDQIDQFLADDAPKAYQRVVDRLLASPDYAETLARSWLDLARYSDTNGYEKDRPRTIWPYRDWVIDAINRDMPFDQFTVEQLAGDMLPAATDAQKIATGFHRNTMLNEEGGIDPLEYRFHALVDRVATTGTVWMGLTVGCAQCHTHKYDPITHTDYYSLMALMNGADEPELAVQNDRDRRRHSELLHTRDKLIGDLAARHLPSQADVVGIFAVNDTEQSNTDATNERIEESEIDFEAPFADFISRQVKDSRTWIPQVPVAMESTMPLLRVLDDSSILASGDVTKRDVYHLEFDLAELLQSDAAVSALRLEALPHESLPAGGPGMAYYEGRKGDFFLSELRVTVDGQPVALRDASHSYGKISVGSGTADAGNVIDDEGSTGWSTSGNEGNASRLVANLVAPIRSGRRMAVEMIFERHFAAALGRFRVALTTDDRDSVASSLPPEVDQWFATSAPEIASIPPQVFGQLQRHFVMTADEFSKHRRPIEAVMKRLAEPPRTLVMKERPAAQRRQTHRHHRGEYLQSKEPVNPGIPAVFAAESGNVGKTSHPVDDRLELARWLVSESNPLGARVTVNRAWRHFFASGIVRTAGDFGTQSEPPSHPELLDWLATEWAGGGMSMKQLHRQIVMSATYRQSTTSDQDESAQTRLLTRFPSRRYEAERIRDTLLSASGLLVRHLGGPSVYPPQPASVTAMAYGNTKWPTSVGGDRFRRSLYTFSKRTAPFAAFTPFAAPTGELCIARRDESTTPLQSLTLLNDEMYLEIAAGLADTAVRSAGDGADIEKIIGEMFVRLLTRQPSAAELDDVKTFFESVRDDGDQQAWKLVARALINLDEAITTP